MEKGSSWLNSAFAWLELVPWVGPEVFHWRAFGAPAWAAMLVEEDLTSILVASVVHDPLEDRDLSVIDSKG